jgi:hypothetical protein
MMDVAISLSFFELHKLGNGKQKASFGVIVHGKTR